MNAKPPCHGFVRISAGGRRLPFYPLQSYLRVARVAARLSRTLSRLGNMTHRLSAELESQAWDLFHSLLTDAESALGPRDNKYSVVDIVQSADGPNMKLEDNEITIIVGPNVQAYQPTLISNIAHETVHTLNPISGYASWLEEGAAIHFELNTIERMFGYAERRHFFDHLPETYKLALTDYEQLLEIDSEAGKTVRMSSTLSTVSAAQLRQWFPVVDERLVQRLVERKQMR